MAPSLVRRHGPVLAVIALFLVYVVNAWTPSHYGQTAQVLGVAHAGPVFGKSRPIRSDEWMVTTPYFQIAAAGDFGPRDVISPYHEPLKAFFALPSRDWSMALKPDLWGFLALDPAHAYSLHYALLAAAFVGGYLLLLRQLGCSPRLALAGSLILFLSQFVQVWWTSNAPVLAWAPWPVAAFLWRGPWWARWPAIAVAVAVWLIGQLYPPLILAAGLAFGVMVAAFRPDALRPARLAPALAAAAAGAYVAWLHYADLIPVMAATVYPGQRLSDGGGFPPLQLLAHLFPYLVTQRYEPLGLWPSNACEIGVAGSFLPLALAVFGDHRLIRSWLTRRRWAVGMWLAGMAVLLAWMLLPIPARLAPVFNFVQPYRMVWGFGLLWLLGFTLMADAGDWIVTRTRVAVFLGLAFAAWAVSKLWLAKAPVEFDRFDLVVAPVLIGLLMLRRARPQWLGPRRLALLAVLLTTALTFGRFNPVQSARPIFQRHDGVALDAFRAYAAANPHGWAVAPGVYGAAINGAGVPAINHTLLQPQLEVFRRVFPDLDAAAFNVTFNRYEHLKPTVQWSPTLIQEDLAAIPPDSFATPLALELAAQPSAAAGAGGAVEEIAATRLGPARWGVTASGWSPWRGVAAGQRLRVALDPHCGRIVQGRAFRLPRPDIIAATNDPANFAAGFGARLVVETARDLPSFPTGALRIESIDPQAGPRTLAAAGAAGC
ncbi:DUF7657 domain-containing protein [Phenylobacterium sp.]|uniref:DUF7657 domain-containing protein n=1 Tax=Phenylobacterium sp. TaxID=1871053 RepID=UPI002F4188EB